MESLLKEYPNVLVLRVRMPIVADLTYPRNFITKIIKYEKVRSPPASRSLPSLALRYRRNIKALLYIPVPKGFIGRPSLRAGRMQIVNIPNSMTVLPELLPLSIEMVRPPSLQTIIRSRRMTKTASRSLQPRNAPTRYEKLLPGAESGRPQARRGLTGIMNYTNPGAISHNEILELYKQYVDPEITWSNFSLEEQAKVIVAPRSNNLLDTARARARPRAQIAQPSGRMLR